MIIDNFETKYTLANNWILRTDPYCSPKEYSIYDINSHLSLYVTEACYILLKIFSQKALTFSELFDVAKRKNIKIDWIGFDNLCKKIAPNSFFVKSDIPLYKNENIVLEEGVHDYRVPVASVPFSAELHFTHRCNLKCKHCFQNSSPTSNLYKELGASQWIDIFEKLERYKIRTITLSGGEVLHYPHFTEVFNEVVNRKIGFNILTNGVLVNNYNIEALSKKNVFLTISLDGHTREIHDALRGNGVYDKVIKNIKLLVEYGASVFLAYTINSNNYMYLKEVVGLACSLGVRGIGFVFTSETGRAKDNSTLILSIAQRGVVKQIYSKLKIEYSGVLELDIYETLIPKIKLDDSVYCAAGTTHVGINSEGKLYPCVYAFSYEELAIGDLTKEDLKDIWENRGKWEMFRGGISLDKINSCSNCALNRKCSMRNCRLRNYGLGRSFYNKPIECLIDYSSSL